MKLLKRLMLYVRRRKRNTNALEVLHGYSTPDYSSNTYFDFSPGENEPVASNEAESFAGFNEGDFGGAGSGESWSDSSSSDSGDSGGDSGGDCSSD
jgi:hypothetical protein